MNKALDEQCAALMGWHRGANTAAISGIAGRESTAYWYDADGLRQAPCVTDTFANMYQWSPSVSHEHARWLELKVERDNLGELYAEYLHQQTYQWNDTLPASRWRAIRATPERARAFVAVYTGELPQ